jgi:endoribonuclease L-PSP
MDIDAIIRVKYGVELPDPPKPGGIYSPVCPAGNLLFLSGQTSTRNGELQYRGIVGKDYTIEQGQDAARICALNLLAALKGYLDGDLSRVKRVVQLIGFVRSAEGFGAQPQVVNGASQVFLDVFGENGLPARIALGTNELPGGAPVEVMIIVEVE